jgi:hypothetical protein
MGHSYPSFLLARVVPHATEPMAGFLCRVPMQGSYEKRVQVLSGCLVGVKMPWDAGPRGKMEYSLSSLCCFSPSNATMPFRILTTQGIGRSVIVGVRVKQGRGGHMVTPASHMRK